MSESIDQSASDTSKLHSSFFDRAILILIALAAAVATCGWVWFLGLLCWSLFAWTVS